MDTLMADHNQSAAAEERTKVLFVAQQKAANAAPFPPAAQRKADLRALKGQLQRFQDVLAVAIAADFGWRAPAESKLIDVMAPVLEINHALSHLKKWMKPSRRATELLFFSNSNKVTYQPKGVVGVIVPWNFPIYLAIGPLVAALAAGNRVMIKMPEITPQTNQALKQLLGEIFPEDQVAVVGEELENPNIFTSLPFNHIVFTGSPAVGKKVMETAAKNLTPVTLELGGKSPAIVTRSYPLKDAAKRLAHGKAFNGGQVCIAPDYAFVPRESLGAFIDNVKTAFQVLYSHTEDNHDYTAIITENHLQRLKDLLDDAQAKGATVIPCGAVGSGKQLPLHIVTGVSDDMRIMHEEIFGPILPVKTYEEIAEAIDYIVERPRPLSLYCFGHEKSERETVLKRTHSGGVTINDWGWHAMNHDAPFGGVGNSGMGSYHGIEGFRELSHAKTVFKRHRFFPIGLFYPPYGTFVQNLSLKLFIGSADPKAALNTATAPNNNHVSQ